MNQAGTDKTDMQRTDTGEPIKVKSDLNATQYLPEIATAPYRGASEFASALTRGTLLGAVAGAAGYFLGERGDSLPNSVYHMRNGRVLGASMAAVGFVLGAYSASREVRAAVKEHRHLQEAMADTFERNQALRTELREQLKAREGQPHNARLEHYNHEWEAGDMPKPSPFDAIAAAQGAATPSSTIERAGAKREAVVDAHSHDLTPA